MLTNHRYLLIATLVMALATVIARALPFVLLYRFKHNPHLQFIGRYLPPAVMLLLCIYCLRSAFLVPSREGFIALGCAALVALIHLWKRNALLSIGIGTAAYVALIN